MRRLKQLWRRLRVLLGTIAVLLALTSASLWLVTLFQSNVVSCSISGPGVSSSSWWLFLKLESSDGVLGSKLEWGRFQTSDPTPWKAEAEFQTVSRIDRPAHDDKADWKFEFVRLGGEDGQQVPQFWRGRWAVPYWALLAVSLALLLMLMLTAAVTRLIFKKTRVASAVCLHCGSGFKSQDQTICPDCHHLRSKVTVSKRD